MDTQILKATKNNISMVVEALENEAIVAIPTETVYGLAGIYHSKKAVSQIFEAKQRPTFDPLIIHLPPQPHWSLSEFEKKGLVNTSSINSNDIETLENLMAYFWPGPLTLILPKHDSIPERVTSGLSTVALRVPAHPVAQSVLNQLGQGLAAPSANIFGHLSPTSADDVYQDLQGRIPYILDGGPCQWGIESTIIMHKPETLSLLRPGALTRAEIRSLLKLNIKPSRHHPAEIQAPGMLDRHYAPHKPMYLFQELDQLKIDNIPPYALVLQHADQHIPEGAESVFYLSQTGDLQEVAKGLFHTLRQAEKSSAEVILTQLPPRKSRGLSDAIINRLLKASEGMIETDKREWYDSKTKSKR